MTFHPLSAIADIVFAAGSATLACRLVALPASRVIRLTVGIIFFAALLVIPVQIFGVLQMLGTVHAVTVPTILLLETVVAGILIAVYLVRRRSSVRAAALAVISWNDIHGYLLIATVVVLATYALFEIDLLTSYPSGWDGLVYHLPLALRWLQTGSLQIPASHVFQFSMPANFEIGMMILLDTGWQSLAPLYNLPFIALLLLSTYAIARRLGGERHVALLVTLTTASMPIIMFQGSSTYVDLSGAACIAAAIALFLEAHHEGAAGKSSWPLVFAAGLACGVAVGTKPVFYPYAALVLALGAVLSLIRQFDRKRLAAVVLVLAISAAVPSIFWFWRAARTTGNPVYPLRVAVGKHVLFPGLRSQDITPNYVEQIHAPSVLAFAAYPWTEKKMSREGKHTITPYSVDSGFGGVFATFVTAGVLFCVWLLLKRQLPRATAVLLLIFVPTMIFWWFELRRYPRFGLLLWIGACLLTWPLYAALSRDRSRLFRIVFVSSIALTCGIAAFQPFARIVHRIVHHEYSRAEYYSYPQVLDHLPAGSLVLNRANEFNFDLAGARLGNRVVPWFEAPNEITPDYLRDAGIDYVVESTGAREHLSNLAPMGAQLIYDDSLPSGFGGTRQEWRVWRLLPQEPAVRRKISRLMNGNTHR